MQVHDIDI